MERPGSKWCPVHKLWGYVHEKRLRNPSSKHINLYYLVQNYSQSLANFLRTCYKSMVLFFFSFSAITPVFFISHNSMKGYVSILYTKTLLFNREIFLFILILEKPCYTSHGGKWRLKSL